MTKTAKFFAAELDVMSHSWSLITAMSFSSVMAFLGAGNGFLLVLALVMQTLEIATEWGSKTRRHREDFDPKKNFVGKLMVLSLVVVALILDHVFVTLSGPDLGGQFEKWMWVTKSALIWIIIGEAVCVIRHIEDSEGKGVIPPAVRWVLRQIRIMDEKRWPGKEGPPPRRWTDDLSDEDIEHILRTFEDKRKAGEEADAIAQQPRKTPKKPKGGSSNA